MKRYFPILFCFLFLFLSIVPAKAASVYGSVTDSSSQVKILFDKTLNDPNFNLFGKWVCARTQEQEYVLFYNIDGTSADYYRYYATTSGYNTTWQIGNGHIDNYSLLQGNFTVVGNIDGALRSSAYQTHIYQTILKYTAVLGLLVLIFFVFRIRKSATKGMNI